MEFKPGEIVQAVDGTLLRVVRKRPDGAGLTGFYDCVAIKDGGLGTYNPKALTRVPAEVEGFEVWHASVDDDVISGKALLRDSYAAGFKDGRKALSANNELTGRHVVLTLEEIARIRAWAEFYGEKLASDQAIMEELGQAPLA